MPGALPSWAFISLHFGTYSTFFNNFWGDRHVFAFSLPSTLCRGKMEGLWKKLLVEAQGPLSFFRELLSVSNLKS